MKNKRTSYAVIAGVCAVVLAALAFLLFYDNSSDEYKTYSSYMEKAGLPALSEKAAQEDSRAICGHYANGAQNRPYSYLDKAEVMAIVKGYCPEYVDVAAWSR